MREIVKRALDFLAGLHSQEWDMQLPIGRQGRATQLAVKRKFFATGGKTKTWKGATLPPSLGPNRDLVWKGKHSQFARHLQRVAGSKVLAELILLPVL